jgi:hypothetical protein
MSIIQRAKVFGLKTLIQFGGRDTARDMAQKWINDNMLQSYGKLTELQIHPGERLIEAELELKGETEPVHVAISGYIFTQRDGKWFIELPRIKTSRDWINALLAEPYLAGLIQEQLRTNPVPEMVRTLLE